MNRLSRAIPIAFPIRRIAALAEYVSERDPVERQPAFDMGVGNDRNHGGRRIRIPDLPGTLVQTTAFRIRGDDDRVGTKSLPRQVPQMAVELLHDPSVAPYRIAPVQPDTCPVLFGKTRTTAPITCRRA